MLKWVVVVVFLLLAVVGMIAVLGSQLPVQHTVSRTDEFRQSPQQVWDIITARQTGGLRFHATRSSARNPHRKWIEYGLTARK